MGKLSFSSQNGMSLTACQKTAGLKRERHFLKKGSLEIKKQLLTNLYIYFVKIRSVYAGVSFSTKSGRQERLLAWKV